MADQLVDSLAAIGSKDDAGNFLQTTYQYTITFDLPTSIIIGFSLTLFFCILYHILYSFFYWIIGTRIYYHRDVEEGTALTSPAGNYSDDRSLSHQVAIFQALIHSNLQGWIMLGALMEESEIVDEQRGEILRATKKLPALVKYGSQQQDNHVTRNCVDCVICLEDFKVGELCQVFPACNHVFHSDCIDCWLASKLTCPTCRNYITD